MHVRGNANKDRRLPIGTELLEVLDDYLRTRATRFPRPADDIEHQSLSNYSPTPLFVGAGGDRITRGTLRYRVLRALKKAGTNSERASVALVLGLRHHLPPNWPTPMSASTPL
jgi:site-specific recombinase XerD